MLVDLNCCYASAESSIINIDASVKITGAIGGLLGGRKKPSGPKAPGKYKVVYECGTPSSEDVDHKNNGGWVNSGQSVEIDRPDKSGGMYILIRKGSIVANGQFPSDSNECSVMPARAGILSDPKDSVATDFHIDRNGHLVENLFMLARTSATGVVDLKIVVPSFTHNGIEYVNGLTMEFTPLSLPISLEDKFLTSSQAFAKVKLIKREIPEVKQLISRRATMRASCGGVLASLDMTGKDEAALSFSGFLGIQKQRDLIKIECVDRDF